MEFDSNLVSKCYGVNMDTFIWTEAIGCGEILRPCLNSYLAHHTQPIHVIGYEEDLVDIPNDSRVIKLEIPNQSIKLSREDLEEAYKFGHKGTALLWSKLITNRNEKYFVHLDADNIFLREVVSLVTERLEDGYVLVGTRRPYRKRVSGGSRFSNFIHFIQRDVVNTNCFGFNRELIDLSEKSLQDFIEGRSRNRIKSRIIPVIDFFDRVSFYLAKKGKIFYLDSQMQRRHGTHNYDGDIEKGLISFSAVGSGAAFMKNGAVNTSESYIQYAKEAYSLYSFYLLGKDTGFAMQNSPYLVNKLKRLNVDTWSLEEMGE